MSHYESMLKKISPKVHFLVPEWLQTMIKTVSGSPPTSQTDPNPSDH